MLNLLVAVDGSAHALRAVHHVINLAKGNGPVTVHLVTAHEEPVVYGEIAVYFTVEKLQDLQEKAAAFALADAEAALKDAGIAYTKHILTGHIPTVIAQQADTLGCDGIVLGSHGRTAAGNLLLGSVALNVAHLAKVPVTLVK